MKSSNLAERLDEFEAILESLSLTDEPVTQRIAPAETTIEAPARLPRRTPRRLTLQIRDQGLRLFRVC